MFIPDSGMVACALIKFQEKVDNTVTKNIGKEAALKAEN